jgi:hypothetical protein
LHTAHPQGRHSISCIGLRGMRDGARSLTACRRLFLPACRNHLHLPFAGPPLPLPLPRCSFPIAHVCERPHNPKAPQRCVLRRCVLISTGDDLRGMSETCLGCCSAPPSLRFPLSPPRSAHMPQLFRGHLQIADHSLLPPLTPSPQCSALDPFPSMLSA